MGPLLKNGESASLLLNAVAKACALREGSEGVAQVLRAVHAAQVLSLKELSVSTRVPLPVLAALRRELEKRKILERRGSGLALTSQGLRFLHSSLGVATRHNPLCPECCGRRIVIHGELRPVLDKLSRYFDERPSIDTSVDQSPCLPETSLRRALYLYRAGALEGRSILILGDDDSVSLAIGLLGVSLGRRDFCRRITVLDTDTRILDHLKAAAASEKLALECISHDLRQPLPKELRGRFDTFETDPPYTVEGADLFLSRAVSALKRGTGHHGLLSFGAKPPAETLLLHRTMQRLQLAIDEIIPSFNEYSGASILGSSSQLIHLLTTPSTGATLPSSHFSSKIYTGELSPTVRVYGCLQCRARIPVGSDQQFKTIELLKAAACPTCGHKHFRYLARMRPRT